MAIETATYINGLDITLPSGSDARSEGDNHLRLLKTTCKNTFPSLSGPVTSTHVHLSNPILQATPATDTLPFYASGTSAATTPLTSYGKTVIGLADAGALRTNLSLDTLYAAKAGATFSGAVQANGGLTLYGAAPSLSITDTATSQTRAVKASGGNIGFTNTSGTLTLFADNAGNGTNTGDFAVGGNFYASGNVTGSSDATLKTNIATATGLMTALKLQGRTFDWVASGASDLGVIAQELQAVLPELVHVNPTSGTLTVNYNGLSAVFIEAIRDLYKEFDTERARSANECSMLREEVASINRRLAALEAR